jgi:DNA-binding response OmpR family regulator
VLDTCNENQIVRLLKEGATDVYHAPFAAQIMASRLSFLLENISVKSRISKISSENISGLMSFTENLKNWEQQCKMRDFQIKVLEEVRTKSESYIALLEDKVSCVGECGSVWECWQCEGV